MGNRKNMSNEKQTLKDKLMAVILLETSKPYKEMDSSLVTECVEFLMDLEGTKRLTKEEIEQKVNDIPFKGKVTAINGHIKKKIKTKRLIIIAAVFAALFIAFSIIAISFGTAPDALIDRLAHHIVHEMRNGDSEMHGNIQVIKANETKTYSSVEELVRDENITILYPEWLPAGEQIVSVDYYRAPDFEEYCLVCSNPEHSILISLNTTIPDEEKESNPSTVIGGHTVYYFEAPEFVQAMFEYNNCLYSIHSNTEENVFKIIENLKEIK